MKIQLKGQSLRIRLSEVEVDDLLALGRCDDVSSVAGLGRWQRRLCLGDAAQTSLGKIDDVWQLTVSREAFTAFVATRPRRDGLQCKLAGEHENAPLQISIEVDLRDAKSRRSG